jgi:hypothetical protein
VIRNDARQVRSRITSRCLLILLASTVGFARPYATNRDGSVFYFSSSYRVSGTHEPFYPKIFVWHEGSGVELYDQRVSDTPVILPPKG